MTAGKMEMKTAGLPAQAPKARVSSPVYHPKSGAEAPRDRRNTHGGVHTLPSGEHEPNPKHAHGIGAAVGIARPTPCQVPGKQRQSSPRFWSLGGSGSSVPAFDLPTAGGAHAGQWWQNIHLTAVKEVNTWRRTGLGRRRTSQAVGFLFDFGFWC